MIKNSCLKPNLCANLKFIVMILFLIHCKSIYAQEGENSRIDCANGEIEIKGDFFSKLMAICIKILRR